MNIFSIQSHVAYGHVGNSAAVFPLQRIGVEVWPVHTVQFSNHPSYGNWQGCVSDAGLIRELVGSIEQRGALSDCDGVLSGYMGGADIGAAILEAVATVKHANAAARYACDPVLGDVGRDLRARRGCGIHASQGGAGRRYRDAQPVRVRLSEWAREQDPGAGRDAVKAVHDLGPRAVLVTSLHTEETPPTTIDLLASDPSGCFRLRTPKLPLVVNGAGDAIAALFFAPYLRAGKIEAALSRAASAIFGVLAKIAEAGAGEIQIVAAQDEIVAPSRVFEAEELGA